MSVKNIFLQFLAPFGKHSHQSRIRQLQILLCNVLGWELSNILRDLYTDFKFCVRFYFFLVLLLFLDFVLYFFGLFGLEIVEEIVEIRVIFFGFQHPSFLVNHGEELGHLLEKGLRESLFFFLPFLMNLQPRPLNDKINKFHDLTGIIPTGFLSKTDFALEYQIILVRTQVVDLIYGFGEF